MNYFLSNDNMSGSNNIPEYFIFLIVESYIFTGVSLSAGESLGRHPSPGKTPLPWADTPPLGRLPSPGQTPPGRHPYGQTHTPNQTATAADGTHPTGMHSCSELKYFI